MINRWVQISSRDIELQSKIIRVHILKYISKSLKT